MLVLLYRECEIRLTVGSKGVLFVGVWQTSTHHRSLWQANRSAISYLFSMGLFNKPASECSRKILPKTSPKKVIKSCLCAHDLALSLLLSLSPCQFPSYGTGWLIEVKTRTGTNPYLEVCETFLAAFSLQDVGLYTWSKRLESVRVPQ